MDEWNFHVMPELHVALRYSLRFRDDGRDNGSDDLVFQEKTLVLVMAPPNPVFSTKFWDELGVSMRRGFQTVSPEISSRTKFSRDTLQHYRGRCFGSR